MPDASTTTWDADFTAESFDTAPAELLTSTEWQVGIGPDRFTTVLVQQLKSWRPENWTEGSLRFTSPAYAELELFPGMPLVVRIDETVVGRATIRTVTNDQRRKNLFPGVLALEWYIMDCGLPDLIWARLRTWVDGRADVLVTGGALERFSAKDDAVSWLSEDEFRELEVFNQCEFDVGSRLPFVWPPDGESDADLAPLMYQRWLDDIGVWKPQGRAG